MKTQEVADLDGGSTQAEFYSMADSSTTAGFIPILFSGGCWARRRLHNGKKYVPTPSKLMKVLSSVELLS